MFDAKMHQSVMTSQRWYAMKPSFILSAQGLWEGAIAGAEIPKEFSIDIDTQHDYDLAKIMYEQLMQSVDWYAAS